MIHDISIPDSQLNWPIKSTDQVRFTFNADVEQFEVVGHPDYFSPRVPSGGFRTGNIIGPYQPNKTKKNVTFKYDNSLVATHTILIGD
jgi:hypothetical protein